MGYDFQIPPIRGMVWDPGISYGSSNMTMLLRHCASIMINNMIIIDRYFKWSSNTALCQQHQQHDYMPAMLLRHCASFLINNMIILMVQQHGYTPATWLHASNMIQLFWLFWFYPPQWDGLSHKHPIPWDCPTNIPNPYSLKDMEFTPPRSHPISQIHSIPVDVCTSIYYIFPATSYLLIFRKTFT